MFDEEAQPGNTRRDRMPVELDETPPASLEAAQAEDRELLSRLLAIDAQLSENKPRDHAWRPKAINEKRHIIERRRFLKDWIFANHSPRGVAKTQLRDAATITGTGTVTALRVITKRIGQLEAVFIASLHYLENDTDEAFLEWERVVTTAREKLKGTGEDDQS